MRRAALAAVDLATGEPQPHAVTATFGKVINGLRGDAVDIAMGIGKETVLIKVGIDLLIQTIHTSLFPMEAQEANILFQ
eukprot:2583064-Pyramimonas_sp.AAC.1